MNPPADSRLQTEDRSRVKRDAAVVCGELKTEGGFNLIEVSMAVAIVAVAMLAIMGLSLQGVDSSRQVANDTLVANLADDMLNWMRITPYGTNTFLIAGANANVHNLTPPISTSQIDADGFPRTNVWNQINPMWAGNKSTGHGYYRFTCQVLDHPEPTFGNAGIARVLIRVQWPINPGTGLPFTNCNTRTYIGQVARR